MDKQVYHIWPDDPMVTLTVVGADPSKKERAALIVVPGGAYLAPAAKEADPVAEHFAHMGYVGCVLRASTMYRSHDDIRGEPNPHTRFPEPMRELACAVATVRKHAEEWGLSPHKIALMGFSAGGHLVGNYGNEWSQKEILCSGDWNKEDIRPDAQILCYAASRAVDVRGGAMLRAIFGGEQWSQEQMDRYDASLHVNGDTPPSFLWHTADDPMVPAEQSYRMAISLQKQRVQHELHIFRHGPHASALATGMEAACWPELADAFLKRVM